MIDTIIPQLLIWWNPNNIFNIQSIAIVMNILFFASISIFISFYIGKLGMNSLLYILKTKKILTSNLRLDYNILKKYKNENNKLKNEIKLLKEKIKKYENFEYLEKIA